MDEKPPKSLWIVVATAVVLRLAAAVYFGDEVRELPGIADQRSYHMLAERVRSGHGFTFAEGWWPATPAGEPTAHWSYLYVMLLAAIYDVAGSHPLVVRLLQAVAVGIMQPYLTWQIARRIDQRAGVPAAAAAAVYGYFVYYAAALMTEAVYIVAVLAVLYLAVRLVERRPRTPANGVSAWIGVGIAGAAAVQLRQLFVLCLPVVLVWMARQLAVTASAADTRGKRLAALGGPALVMLVCVLSIAPWTVRNYREFGELVPLNTNAGFAFFWGNHPVHGYRFQPLLDSVEYGALIPAELRGLNEAALDKALFARGIGFVAAEPLRYLSLCAGRVVEYFKFWPTSESGTTSNVARLLSFGLMLPLIVLGTVYTLRSSRAGVYDERSRACGWLLVWVAASHTAAYVLTWTLVRYRLPVDAMLMPFAGVAMLLVGERVRSMVRPARVASLQVDGPGL